MALPKNQDEWQLAEAEANLRTVLDRAMAGEPQQIILGSNRFTVSAETAINQTNRPKMSFEEFLLTIPKLAEDEELDIPPRSSFDERPVPFDDVE